MLFYLAHWARKLSWQETAVSFRTSWDKVCQSVELCRCSGVLTIRNWLTDRGDRRRRNPVCQRTQLPGNSGLPDRAALHAPAYGSARERTVESFGQFFTLIGEELAGRTEFVCSDMWQPGLRVIRERCSQAIHILDRFHMCRQDSRRTERCACCRGTRWLAQDGYEPILKKACWCVLKRKANLTELQRFRLRDLLQATTCGPSGPIC